MEIRHGVQRLADFGRALRMGRRELAGTARLGADQLRERQHRMLQGLVRHARAASPLYRDLYRSVDPERFELADLPTVAKPQLMDRFDDWVTDPALDLAGVERHLAGLAGDGLYLGRSGSSPAPAAPAAEASSCTRVATGWRTSPTSGA